MPIWATGLGASIFALSGLANVGLYLGGFFIGAFKGRIFAEIGIKLAFGISGFLSRGGGNRCKESRPTIT